MCTIQKRMSRTHILCWTYILEIDLQQFSYLSYSHSSASDSCVCGALEKSHRCPNKLANHPKTHLANFGTATFLEDSNQKKSTLTIIPDDGISMHISYIDQCHQSATQYLELKVTGYIAPHQPNHFLQSSINHAEVLRHTVDGRNPAPPGMYKTL